MPIITYHPGLQKYFAAKIQVFSPKYLRMNRIITRYRGVMVFYMPIDVY